MTVTSQLAANGEGICEVADFCVHAASFTLLLLITILLVKCNCEAAILQIQC